MDVQIVRTAPAERWQGCHPLSCQDALHDAALHQTAIGDLEMAYNLQLDEIMKGTEGDSCCTMFEEEVEECKLRRAAMEVQVSLCIKRFMFCNG